MYMCGPADGTNPSQSSSSPPKTSPWDRMKSGKANWEPHGSYSWLDFWSRCCPSSPFSSSFRPQILARGRLECWPPFVFFCNWWFSSWCSGTWTAMGPTVSARMSARRSTQRPPSTAPGCITRTAQSTIMTARASQKILSSHPWQEDKRSKHCDVVLP